MIVAIYQTSHIPQSHPDTAVDVLIIIVVLQFMPLANLLLLTMRRIEMIAGQMVEHDPINH